MQPGRRGEFQKPNPGLQKLHIDLQPQEYISLACSLNLNKSTYVIFKSDETYFGHITQILLSHWKQSDHGTLNCQEYPLIPFYRAVISRT